MKERKKRKEKKKKKKGKKNRRKKKQKNKTKKQNKNKLTKQKQKLSSDLMCGLLYFGIYIVCRADVSVIASNPELKPSVVTLFAPCT